MGLENTYDGLPGAGRRAGPNVCLVSADPGVGAPGIDDQGV